MICSFRDRDTRALFEGRYSRRFQNVASVAERKLAQLHSARELSDLARFPGNRLEALKGDRSARHSIRINDQFRLIFVWREGDAYDVEIIDYH